jgi:hypothetical protein
MLGVILLASIIAPLVVGWLVHRPQRDIDGFHERDYREPPVFSPPGW